MILITLSLVSWLLNTAVDQCLINKYIHMGIYMANFNWKLFSEKYKSVSANLPFLERCKFEICKTRANKRGIAAPTCAFSRVFWGRHRENCQPHYRCYYKGALRSAICDCCSPTCPTFPSAIYEMLNKNYIFLEKIWKRHS